jgi:hypothetical protein
MPARAEATWPTKTTRWLQLGAFLVLALGTTDRATGSCDQAGSWELLAESH